MKSVYVMESDLGLVKLGISNNPSARLRTIRSSSGVPVQLVHSSSARPDARAVEAAAHKLLSEKRRAGEWFDVSPDEAIEAIAQAVKIVEADLVSTADGVGGSELVAIRYPVWMLKIVSELMRERGGPGVVDRATVMREVMVRGFEAMGKSAR